ncbi:tumor necrosis factor alpha-induced protein 2 [Rhineura floridana]|uniref:tumor necrosis factor alpha-induced protein 2 n=1 Tax=Rhineura floridana TaxID=261503 RepID=UPI002AC7EAFD|nr:tumor necrosis factor alpha-induced protein 2 [Rhineura floridana]
MMKPLTFFYTSSPKPDKECEAKSKAANPSTSSESELDSMSLESSTEEAHPKDNMKTENHRQDSALGYPPGSPSETNGTCPCTPEQKKKKKKKKGIRGKIIGALYDITVGKSKVRPLRIEKDPPKEESQPITVDQIRELIKDQKFFDASQHLLVMEKECNGDSDSNSKEENMDNQNEIEDLFGLLKQEVLRIIRSSVNIGQAEPELLQDAVRTVAEQVEEDDRCALEEKASGKPVRSRPRKWKEDWRNTVQASVTERMKEPPFDVNEGLSTTAYSFRHLGKTMKQDLITVVQYVKPHYPEHFQVCSTYAEVYHHCFSSQLETIVQFELGIKDTYLLLTWVWNIYPNEIRNHPVLVKELDKASLGSLLPLKEIRELEATYLANEADSVKRWLTKCLEMEVTKWTQGKEPEKLDGHFHSELQIDAIRTIYGGQKRAEGIRADLGKQISALLLEELLAFLQSYKKELDIFIKENKQHRHFEATIIANINNCLSFRTHTKESAIPGQDYLKVKMFNTLNEIQNAGFDVLLQSLFQELQTLFKKFTQKKWVSCTNVMDEIIATTSHYVSTFKTLKDPLHQAIMGKIHLYLVQEHIARVMRKKVSLRTPELQNNLSELIRKNASILCTFCTENGSNAKWLDFALPSLAEIIKLQDTAAIMVEVGVLASKYPDVSKKHLSAILYIKGNLSSSETRSILSVLDIGVNATLPPMSLFSTIRVS